MAGYLLMNARLDFPGFPMPALETCVPIRNLRSVKTERSARSDGMKRLHGVAMRARSEKVSHGVLVGPGRKGVVNAIDSPGFRLDVARRLPCLNHG